MLIPDRGGLTAGLFRWTFLSDLPEREALEAHQFRNGERVNHSVIVISDAGSDRSWTYGFFSSSRTEDRCLTPVASDMMYDELK